MTFIDFTQKTKIDLKKWIEVNYTDDILKMKSKLSDFLCEYYQENIKTGVDCYSFGHKIEKLEYGNFNVKIFLSTKWNTEEHKIVFFVKNGIIYKIDQHKI